jgi:hypothetical protein
VTILDLLPKCLEKRFSEVGRQEEKGYDALVLAKYFHCLSNWTWFATEYYPKDREFFGYVCGHEDEWGNFSLDELKEVKVRGLGIERDLYFGEKPLRKALEVIGKEPKW